MNDGMKTQISEKTNITYYRWIVWGLGAAFFFFEYIVRVSPGVIASELMHEFHTTATGLGSLSAFFYYAYVGMQIPVGVLVDRFGVRRLLIIMSILTAISCILFSTAVNLKVAEFARFLMGFSASFAFVGTLKLVSVWFPSNRVGLLSGLTQAMGMLGAAVGKGPTAAIMGFLGWRLGVTGMGVIFLVLAVLIMLFVRDRPPKSLHQNTYLSTGLSQHDSYKNVEKRLHFVLLNPQTWINAAYAGLLYAPTACFAELWGESFFRQTYGIDNQTAATAVGLIFIGWFVGGPFMGWLSDRLQRRRPILIVSAITGCIILSAIIFINNLPLWLLFTLLFLYGVSNTGLVISYAVAAEINPHSMAGTSLGITNMASVIIGAAFQPLIGKFLDWYVGPQVAGTLSVYSATSFRLAMTILPICLALSIVLAFFIRETYCRNVMQQGIPPH